MEALVLKQVEVNERQCWGVNGLLCCWSTVAPQPGCPGY